MLNLLNGLKTLVVGIMASASVIVSPVNPAIHKVASPSAIPAPVVTQETEDNNIQIQGSYSYIGQSINYSFSVPKKGGSFSGSVQGACVAQVNGNYEGGDGGKISGNATGSCNMFGIKAQGSTGFSGHLYPNNKTLELDIDNSPIHGFTIKYGRS